MRVFRLYRSPTYRTAGCRRSSTPHTRSPPKIDAPEGGAEGVIVTEGGRFGGLGLYLLKSKPVFTWNCST
jgi:hypothetical protein